LVSGFSNLQNILCGESRGMSINVNLLECTEDIHIHLVSCHLSKSSLKEYEIILARADLFHLENEQLKSSLPKSSKHSSLILETSSFLLISRTCREKTLLQRSWSNAVIFSYPRKCTNVLFGTLVQIGSRKHFKHHGGKGRLYEGRIMLF
jgi:hypothetical protein